MNQISERLASALADRYRITRQLGEGGMATVYLAEDLKHDRKVAVKVLRPELAAVLGADRFIQEIKTTANLQHPHILPLFDSGEADSFLYYVMPYVEGETLRQKLDRETQLGIEEAIEIATVVADALDYAHRQGVIHRDIKPENILLHDGRPVVADFGIALAVTEAGGNRVTETGLSLGTPQYMSPEQATGERNLGARSDVYSLAAVLYEMLTGEAPVTGANAQAMIAKLMTEKPTRVKAVRDTVPLAVDASVAKALSKVPADRYGGAREFAEALRLADAPAVHQSRRRPAMVIGVVAVVTLMILGGLWAWSAAGSRPAAPPAPRFGSPRQVTFTGDVRSGALSPDGRSAVYLASGMDRVELVDLDGGGSTTLYRATDGASFSSVSWGPEGNRVYLAFFPYANRVISIPRLGGTPRQELDLSHLTGVNGLDVHKLSGDRWLVSGSSDLYIGNDPSSIRAAGSRLIGEGVFVVPNRFYLGDTPTRDGSLVALPVRVGQGNATVAVLDTRDGSIRHGEGPWLQARPVGWSEADGRLYLAKQSDPLAADLLSARIDSGSSSLEDPVIVLERMSSIAPSIGVSADGNRIVTVSGSSVSNVVEFTLDATSDAGDNPRRSVTSGTGLWYVLNYFPNGDILASLGQDLYRLTPEGQQSSVVSGESPLAWTLAISPDGRTVAVPDSGGRTIVLHDIGSGRRTPITIPFESIAWDWSADGRFIAGMTIDEPDKIVVIDVERGEAAALELDCKDRCEFASELIAMGPQWPWAAITSEVDVWIVNLETGALRHLASETWNVSGWIDDQIYFARAGGQAGWPGITLFRIPAGGGPAQRLLDIPVTCTLPLVSPDGGKIACNNDESRYDLFVIDAITDAPND